MNTLKIYAIELTRTGTAKIHKAYLPQGMSLDMISKAKCGARARAGGWAIASDENTMPLCERCFKKGATK